MEEDEAAPLRGSGLKSTGLTVSVRKEASGNGLQYFFINTIYRNTNRITSPSIDLGKCVAPISTSFVKGTGNDVKTLVACISIDYNHNHLPVRGLLQQSTRGRTKFQRGKKVLKRRSSYHIHRLNELVRSLQQQLLQCRGNNETTNGTVSRMTEHVIELERQLILDN
ncbi:hypothetical protein Dsin_019686 [Dipteronia sinensis]|uniref:Uncharacterized protein n=1 Tax=Dipteronia sinensis TaxID=43782 RepID=A0AAE0A807_9ROSI|nr:hypothetical protein Dsin_019686 [Dipteronia sinensis]